MEKRFEEAGNKKDFLQRGLKISFYTMLGFFILSAFFTFFYTSPVFSFFTILVYTVLAIFILSLLFSTTLSIINLIKKRSKLLPIISLIVFAIFVLLALYILLSLTR